MHFDDRSNQATRASRRKFIRVAGLGGAALAGGLPCLGASTSDLDPARLRLMEFDVTYRTQVMKLPSDAQDVRIWMPIPTDDAAQTISNFEVDSPVPFEFTRTKTFGSKTLFD